MASNRRGTSRTRAAVVALPVRGPVGRVGALLPSGRSVAVGLGLVALAVGTYSLARSTSAFAVEEIRVEGTTPAVARQVRAALERDVGTSLLALDRDLVARLEALPDVRTAVYDRAFPHTLVVRVERELPAAVLRRGHESWLVSERGRVLRSLPRGRHPRLPRVWVAGGRPLEPGQLLRRPAVAQSMLVVRALPSDFPVAVRSVAVRNGVALPRPRRRARGPARRAARRSRSSSRSRRRSCPRCRAVPRAARTTSTSASPSGPSPASTLKSEVKVEAFGPRHRATVR